MIPCPVCHGIGELAGERCLRCQGRGYLTPDDTLRGDVAIPADIRRRMRPGCAPTSVFAALGLMAIPIGAMVIALLVLAIRSCAGHQ